uniref:G-protein coupled receptor 98-like isoform X2 n=1 Tax=Ciona intestinalis TaxID=7719 RepID=UPI00089DC011|nr:G-protein coupled receptor 98-like isoform X2 [Ciona intestinalis]|eukprot:XP_018671881.1 G-protein coupled receptor 98-like isoform X2 [Ciona intestinalis]
MNCIRLVAIIVGLAVCDVIGQNQDVCAVGSGWSYSSSYTSSSSSFATSSSSSSSSTSSSVCVQAKVPEDCIKVNPNCQWCAQEDFSGQRCNIQPILEEQGCSDLQIIESSVAMDAANEANRFDHQSASARIRVGGNVNINFRIREPMVYPVDFYYLMDVSYSMLDDLKSVQTLAQQLVATLQELTQGGTGSVKLGFGKFVDKVQSPMTQMTPYKLQHPYGSSTDAPFLFRNVIDLTSDVDKFEQVLSKQNVSGNLDPPEGALDAMLQVVKCKELIGWRGDALRLLMVATESAFHFAGDGSGYLAGISRANDGRCHTGGDGIYVGAEEQDYPTVNQVVRAVEENSITPIFAIGKTYADMYKYVSEDVFRGSTWGILKKDSSNVVDLVRRAYLDITGKQEIVTSNPDDSVLCPWYHVTRPGGAMEQLSVDGTLVGGLESGSKVYYNMSLYANRGACAGATSCPVGDVIVKTRQYDDKLTIATSVVSAFGCAATVIVNSPSCSGNGNFSCGICRCLPAWGGSSCSIPVEGKIGCLPLDGGAKCSGRGKCLNNRCQCDPGYRHGKSKIFGDFCECDECPVRAGLVCSGNGRAVTGTGCSCDCVCDAGWEGSDCACASNTTTCMGLGGEICSGFGQCVCGACVCDVTSGYSGPTCSDCVQNCPSCAAFKDCIQCTMHQSGALADSCVTSCNDEVIEVGKNSMKEEDIDEASGEVLCAALDKIDNCKFYYSYKPSGSGMVFKAEVEKRCKPEYSLLIILWCILLFLLIGLILLCCWRCCVYVIDKEESKNYKLSNIAMMTSPALIPLLPAMGAGSVIEFIKSKYMARKSARMVVIPVRRSFFNGSTSVRWRTYAGSSMDDDYEVLSQGEEGTLARKGRAERVVVHGKNGDSTIEVEPLLCDERGAGQNGQHTEASTMRFESETLPLIEKLNWGDGEITFRDDEEFSSIEIPLMHDFSGREVLFWVELFGEEKGVALGLRRTKVIVIKDEESGILGFPKPNFVFKENDGFAIVPVHRTVGMDGHVGVTWYTRDITGINGKHYVGGRGVIEFGDGEVIKQVQVALIPDIIYDETEKAFNIMLEDPTGGATVDLDHCMVSLLSDEECALVQFPKDAYPFMENCGLAEVVVMRTRSTKGVSQVTWRTEDDTAVAGKDYVASGGIVTFANAATEAHVTIPIIDNDVYDDTGRAFRVILSDPSEGTKLSNNVATISIIEDDEPGMFEFTKTRLVMRSKDTLGRLSVIRSLGSDGIIGVKWGVRAVDGGQLPPDVVGMGGWLEFQHQEIDRHLPVDLTASRSCEMIKFMIILEEVTGGGRLGSKKEAEVTIFAEEDFGTVSFVQSQFEVPATTGMATLLVSRKGGINNSAFVICETTDQSAISGSHYRGGTISVVFDVDETVKEVGIPVYNDPNHKGQLFFGVALRSTPGGPKIGDPSTAVVAITCIPMTPVLHAGFSPPGACTVEFLKSKYLCRRSIKVIRISIHRSSPDGSCVIHWEVRGPTNDEMQPSRRSRRISSSSEEDDVDDIGWGRGQVRMGEDQSSATIHIDLEDHHIFVPQISLQVELVSAEWTSHHDDKLQLGLKQTEVVIVNDIDAGTLGFSKSTFSFKESDGIVVVPVHRLGGMDGVVSARWRTVDGSAKDGEDYAGGHGVVNFDHNQIMGNIEISLLGGDGGAEERRFEIELYKIRGGARTGMRKTTVYIISDEERSFVQFSKDAYPVIGNSTTVKIPVLRTGSFQDKVLVIWRTIDGTAKSGVDYQHCQGLVEFEAGETKSSVEIPIMGKSPEAREFTVELESDPKVGLQRGARGRVTIGRNERAVVAIISNRDPGKFEFSKPSHIFRSTGGLGMVPVIRSEGTDGEVALPWKIESLDDPSPFAGAEGFLTFHEGQVTSSIEIGLEGVPSDAFAIVLLPSSEGPVLGSQTRTNVTIIGEIDAPIIEMEKSMMSLKGCEVIEVRVLRRGDISEATYVGWKTTDGGAVNGRNFIGGAGNLVFDPNEESKSIQIPVLAPPNDQPADFTIRLTDVRGCGKLGDVAATTVTLEPVPKTIVEFVRKRHMFRQSDGNSLIPVRRSDAHGMVALQWQTYPIVDEITQSNNQEVDWGSGILTFEDGEYEANIEIILCREMPTRESNFKVELHDTHDRVTLGVPITTVTVIRDKDPGLIGFASPRFDFNISDDQLVVPVHRTSGSDGTVAVPWFTRDGTAVGGSHYLPCDGNLIYNDGEVLKRIVVKMPRRVGCFNEDQVSFKICLSEPAGGATLSVHEAHVVLLNDIVPAQISFPQPRVTCDQSSGTVLVPVERTNDSTGLVTLSWQSRGCPGKHKSRYETLTGTIVFEDGEDQKDIAIKLPPQVQATGSDAFMLELEQPTSGRATLGESPMCTVVVNNDIIPGNFSVEKKFYNFKQSSLREKIRIVRSGGVKGGVSIPWRVLPLQEGAPPSSLHDLHGSADFSDGQTTCDVTIPLPEDTDEDREEFIFILLPPGGRAELEDPFKAEMSLSNDLKCEISFTKPVYEVRGDVDTLLVPVLRDGPKGRPVAVDYYTKDGSAVDCVNYIGGEGTLSFDACENKTDVLVPIMNDVHGGCVTMTIHLGEVMGPAELGANQMATIKINNVAGAGSFEMASRQQSVKQTQQTLEVIVVRRNGSKGSVTLPWYVDHVTSRSDGYDDLQGTLSFADGETEKSIEIPLTPTPQDDEITSVDVTLLTPTSGGGVALGEVTTTRVNIENDIDGGIVNFEKPEIEAFGTDGDVIIPVVRTGMCTHPCQVTWEATDDTALRGKHYRANKGTLNFPAGGQQEEITIPIVNDPSGDVMYFNVAITTTKGGVKVGSRGVARVMIDHVQEMTKVMQIQQQSSPPVHGRVGFANSVAEAKQSEKKIVLKVERKGGNTGRLVVPWSVETGDKESPYYNLHGQETFRDGEDESHIEIEMPEVSQEQGAETFSVILGHPTGGASLSGDTECQVTVDNDVVPAVVGFEKESIVMKQSEEVVTIPIVRSGRIDGKVRVPWKTTSTTPSSPYDGLSGLETFEGGEGVSHIEVKLPQSPRDDQVDEFNVVIGQPKNRETILGDVIMCKVTVENDIASGLIELDQRSLEATQSNGKVDLIVRRRHRTTGRVVVPWRVVPQTNDSVYVGLVDEVTMADGSDEAVIEVKLPALPLQNGEEKIQVVLEPPVGAHAKLGDNAACDVIVTHDVGEGVVEMRSHDTTCMAEDGEAEVTIVRKMGHDFGAEVAWLVEDEDAVRGKHYEGEGGRLKFKPGESERSIRIPVNNDPTGDDRHFLVRLQEVKGRDKLGDVIMTRVKITNEATPPSVVSDFDADLVAPHVIKTSWLPPHDGAPVTGYKVTYWSRPGTVKTEHVPADVYSTQLEGLQPSTPYQVNVRALNGVGDGPPSDTTMVETQPELRLSYHSPMQAKTSQKVAHFTLKRNIKDFYEELTWVVTKEMRRKSDDDSSTSSSQSSSSSDDSDSPHEVARGSVTFNPGEDTVVVDYPLKQNMRHASQVYRLLMRKQPCDDDRERPLANVELNVINDTGYPGRTRKPFASSVSPCDCSVSWESPAGGGPVDGYQVVAKTKGEPDLMVTVGPDERRTILTGLKPSTDYDIIVYPFNEVGEARPSQPAHVTTQDELKVEFSEKFYSFKASDKVAVIPLKRHFTRGYATLNWNARWCKRHEDNVNSDSESDSEGRARDFASGSITFPDGSEGSEVRIPLQQVPPKKKSFFWINISDPNRKKRLAQMRCSLLDDRAYGVIGFETSAITKGYVDDVTGAVAVVPLVRGNGTEGHVTASWVALEPHGVVSSESRSGVVTFCDGDNAATVAILLNPDWLERSCDPIVVNIELTEANRGATIDPDKRTCHLTLMPAERGTISIKSDCDVTKWPIDDGIIEFKVERQDGTHGPVYLKWKVNDIGGEVGEYVVDTSGEVRMTHGEDEVAFGIKMKDCEHGPRHNVVYDVIIYTTTPGVKIKEGCGVVTMTMLPNLGIVGFSPIDDVDWPTSGIGYEVVREESTTGGCYLQYEILGGEELFVESGDIRMSHGESRVVGSIPAKGGAWPDKDVDVTLQLFPVTLVLG